MNITPLRLGLDRPGDCDLANWGPRIRIACRHGRFRQFEKELDKQIGDKPRGPIWIGSGDFHHVSLALLRRVTVPCNVLVLDLHPDWVRGVPFIHCGTWVAHALRLPHVHRIFHVGGDMDFDNRFRFFAPWRDLQSGRLTVWPARRRFTNGKWHEVASEPLFSGPLPPPSGSRPHFSSPLPPSCPLPPCGGGLGWGVEPSRATTPQEGREPDGGKGLDRCGRLADLMQSHLADLAAHPLYISLDKDVMIQIDAITNWEPGFLSLDHVRTILTAFISAANGRLAGMDITGDWSPVRTQGLFRSWLDRTEHPKMTVDATEAASLNARTDSALLEHLRGLDIQWIP